MDKLIVNMCLFEGKMVEVKSKKDMLKVCVVSVKMNKVVSDMVSGVSTSFAFGAFERMEEKVFGMEVEVEVMGVFVVFDNFEV